MILLDTDICVELLRGNMHVMDSRAACVQEVCISAMSVGELVFGAYRSSVPERNLARLDRLLSTLLVLPSDRQVMFTYGRLRAVLVSRGMPLPDADTIIAATALTHCDGLASGNTAHMERFPGLRLENWLV